MAHFADIAVKTPVNTRFACALTAMTLLGLTLVSVIISSLMLMVLIMVLVGILLIRATE